MGMNNCRKSILFIEGAWGLTLNEWILDKQ